MPHITTTIRHDLHSVPRLLQLHLAFCLHAVQATYTFAAAGRYRRYLFSLETLRKFGKFMSSVPLKKKLNLRDLYL